MGVFSGAHYQVGFLWEFSERTDKLLQFLKEKKYFLTHLQGSCPSISFPKRKKLLPTVC